MDVDNLRKTHRCYGCGQTRHFCRDCPNPRKKLDMRMVLSDLTDEERVELQNEMLMKEEVENPDKSDETVKDFYEGQ